MEQQELWLLGSVAQQGVGNVGDERHGRTCSFLPVGTTGLCLLVNVVVGDNAESYVLVLMMLMLMMISAVT